MMHKVMNVPAGRFVLGVAAVVVFGACSRMPSIPNPLAMVGGSATLHVELPAPAGAMPLLRNGQPLVLAVSDVSDARPGVRGRKLGNIKATVANLHSSEIELDRDIPAFVGDAVKAKLAADGFRIVPANVAADFRLMTTLKAFSLDIAGSDELRMVAEVTLREAKTGDVIWSGLVSESEDRYAGVTGNSRGTIIESLAEGTGVFTDKLSAAVRDGLIRSYPKSLVQGGARLVSTIPGVTLLHEPTSRESTPAPVATPAPAVVAVPAVVTAVAARSGFVSIYSQPTRAKVYIDDVYYGVTPQRLELPVGVANVGLRLDGYKATAEKVAVRPGQTTELEVKLSK